ncbi:hypothetical protein LB531_20895 [Mesorhizobium sp. CO1-1-2]|uniref:hypothetical protein n=1 Tax=Mesorhizobium sp. CO1-1-2 TaxID=2876635 RepID=UPI001CCC5648|nr:hypothetical protein [Mesorhizobium sp. CO1-1-2]MBZ9683119.1 hypothetical protein [Mesorhizobium sp. CO1-1-2]
MEVITATRQDLLIKLIGQLQADHDLAVKSGNVGAAVTASRAIADLLSVKDESNKPEDRFRDLDNAQLENMIRLTAASLRADGFGHLFDNDSELTAMAVAVRDGDDVAAVSTHYRNADDALAARIMALLEGKPQ